MNADATASKYIKGFGLQWNMLPIVSALTSKNLPILQTEHKCGNYPWDDGDHLQQRQGAERPRLRRSRAGAYIRDWIKAGVTSYSSWNMVLDTIGKGIDAGRVWPQNALLTVDRSGEDADRDAGLLRVPPLLAVRRRRAPSASRPPARAVDALAFKNPDGSIVAVMYNAGTAAKTTTFAIGGAKPAVLRPRQRLRDDQEVAAGSRAPRPEQRRRPDQVDIRPRVASLYVWRLFRHESFRFRCACSRSRACRRC